MALNKGAYFALGRSGASIHRLTNAKLRFCSCLTVDEKGKL